MAKTMDEISQILETIKFRKKIVGGVDQEDVWRILGKLQKEYEELFSLEEAAHQAIVKEREETITALRKKLKRCKERVEYE